MVPSYSSIATAAAAAAPKADNVEGEKRAAVVSPYFASTPQLRKSPRKKAKAAVALMTAALATTTPSSTAAAAWVPTPNPTGSRLSPATTAAKAKRVAASVTPPSSLEDQDSSPSPGTTTPNKKAKKSPAKKSSPSKKQAAKEAPMTNSFGPLCSKRYTDKPVPVHTLILGTHPSIASLSQAEYYGHDMNAFWWIAGDCLGFRRKAGVKKNGEPFGFTKHVRHDNILPYDEQQKTMVMHGFAMWDVIGSCQRPGSLDQDIRNETPNNIHEFANQHKGTLRRIVLANGGTGSAMFVKHFRPWLKSGELQPLAGHEASEKAFGKATKSHLDNKGDKITLISALSVSPAAARYSYTEKRDFWEEHVYQPGIADHEENLKSLQTMGTESD